MKSDEKSKPNDSYASVNEYISNFEEINKLPRSSLLKEMDRVWDKLNLDNTKPIHIQIDGIRKYYSHPVWILNGLFSEADPESLSHRESIARYIQETSATRVADYGGGSGTLALIITKFNPESKIDIIEPFPNPFFKEKISRCTNIRFIEFFEEKYDVCIAQDVLEHMDNPIATALKIINSVKLGGTVIFANCFYPDIKCHLPKTFYLRHTFKYILMFAGLNYAGNLETAKHIQVFKKLKEVSIIKLKFGNIVAHPLGCLLNFFQKITRKLKTKK